MKSSRRLNLSFFVFCAAVVLLSGTRLHAAPADEILKRITDLEGQITSIEKEQDDILKKQEEILAELANLKVWVRRN